VEFERARRYERSVTVAVFTGPAARAGNGANGHHAPGAVDPRSLAGVLASATREVDLVTCHAHSCVVVLPEIGPEEGIRAVRRMREVCAGRLSAPIAAGIAVFPEDGWLFLDLVDVALRNARTAGDEERAAVRDGAMVADRAGVPVRAERAQGT